MQEGFDFLNNYFVFNLYLFMCNFEVFSFILVLENKRDWSPHKSALSCLCFMCSVSCLGDVKLTGVTIFIVRE